MKYVLSKSLNYEFKPPSSLKSQCLKNLQKVSFLKHCSLTVFENHTKVSFYKLRFIFNLLVGSFLAWKFKAQQDFLGVFFRIWLFVIVSKTLLKNLVQNFNIEKNDSTLKKINFTHNQTIISLSVILWRISRSIEIP